MKYASTFSVAGVNSANNVLAQLKAAATDLLQVLEIGMFIEAVQTNAAILALQRMNAVGTGAITSTAGVPQDSRDPAATAVLETAWATTKPTLLSNTLLRRFQCANTIASGIIWDFTNRPLIVPVSGGLDLIQVNASGATLGTIGGWVVWDE
jgi:hypothetical protein